MQLILKESRHAVFSEVLIGGWPLSNHREPVNNIPTLTLFYRDYSCSAPPVVRVLITGTGRGRGVGRVAGWTERNGKCRKREEESE